MLTTFHVLVFHALLLMLTLIAMGLLYYYFVMEEHNVRPDEPELPPFDPELEPEIVLNIVREDERVEVRVYSNTGDIYGWTTLQYIETFPRVRDAAYWIMENYPTATIEEVTH